MEILTPKIFIVFFIFGSKTLVTDSKILFICVVVPIPKAPASIPKIAKQTANHFHFLPIPSSMYVKGPPTIVPSFSLLRNLTARNPSAYFVAMPNMAAKIIQNNAPGPPILIAVATPIIFPVPKVAAIEIHRAPKEETSPSPESS